MWSMSPVDDEIPVGRYTEARFYNDWTGFFTLQVEKALFIQGYRALLQHGNDPRLRVSANDRNLTAFIVLDPDLNIDGAFPPLRLPFKFHRIEIWV